MIFFHKQNAKWNANLDSLSSLGPQELFKYLGQLNPCVERSAIKNLSSINTFKSLKNVENCLWRRAHKGNCQFSWAWEKLHFLSRICRSVLSSSGYEGVSANHTKTYQLTSFTFRNRDGCSCYCYRQYKQMCCGRHAWRSKRVHSGMS